MPCNNTVLSANHRNLPPLYPPVHLLVEPYCIFCRETLISKGDFVNERHDELQPWDLDVFCFFDIPGPKQLPPCRRIHIFRADLRRSGWRQGDERLRNILKEADMKLHTHYSHFCDPEVTANLAHSACLQLAKSTFADLTVPMLCRIARKFRPILPWSHAVRIFDLGKGTSKLPLASQVSQATGLGCLISKIHKMLPPEVQGMIYDQISKNTLLTSLMSCLALLGSVDHERVRHGKDTEIRYLPLLMDPNQPYMESLQAEAINILGEWCLVKVGTGLSSTLWIPIERQPIRCFQYSLSSYGVAALRIHYCDGTISPWLGPTRGKWVASLPGNKLNELQFLSDGFKIISISSNHESTKPRMLWPQNLAPPEGCRNSLIDIFEPGVRIRGNVDKRFGRPLYLNFFEGQSNSLTFFCGVDALCGVQFNGDSQSRIGQPHDTSCALTFYFQPGEVVSSLHVVTRGEKDPLASHGPYILITTSQGRTFYYGPHLTWYFNLIHFSNFRQESSYSISGIFIDPTTSILNIREQTIGLILEPTDNQNKQKQSRTAHIQRLENLDPYSFLASHGLGCFFTKSHLKNLKRLQLQKKGTRYLDMLIQRQDDTYDVLGQWEPSEGDTIITLYECETGTTLESITFVYSDGENQNRSHIEEVRVNSFDVSGSPSFKWDKLDQELYWAFTFRYDFVEYWLGRDVSIRITGCNIPSIDVD